MMDLQSSGCVEIRARLSFTFKAYNNNNNDRLTAFDPGQPG